MSVVQVIIRIGTHGIGSSFLDSREDLIYPTRRLFELTEFIRINKPSQDQLVEFLVTHSLTGFHASHIWFSAVRESGAVFYPAGFGYDPKNFLNTPERLVSTETPGNKTLRDGTVNYCGSFDEYLFSNISNADALFPQGFAASVSFPIPGFGGVIVMFQKPFQLTAQFELFFKSIGSILGMHLAKVSQSLIENGVEVKGEPAELLTLTKRQWEILDRIRKGATNNEIALELAYSESTIRHETMRIYEKLRVNGRKDILSPNFDLAERQIG